MYLTWSGIRRKEDEEEEEEDDDDDDDDDEDETIHITKITKSERSHDQYQV